MDTHTNLLKTRSTSCRSHFFNQRIINVWNSLPNNTVDSASFQRAINNVDYSEFLKVFTFNFITVCITSVCDSVSFTV